MWKNILIAFGLLDLYSLIRTYKLGIKLLDNFEHVPILNSLEILLIVSLLVSGVLSIMRKKSALVIYYFQIPLRIIFMILTFGFLIKLFGFQYDSVGYKIMVIIASLLELVRLTYSIMIHKKEFKTKKCLPITS